MTQRSGNGWKRCSERRHNCQRVASQECGTSKSLRGLAASTVTATAGPCQRITPTFRGSLQGIAKLEGDMQQLRGLLASFASMVISLKVVAAADPSKCAPGLSVSYG